MKKTYLLVALRTVQRKKLYSLLSIIAVVIAVFLFATGGFVVDTLQQVTLAMYERSSGRYHVQVTVRQDDNNFMKKLLMDDRIDEITESVHIGVKTLSNGASFMIEEWAPDTNDLYGLGVLEGRMPQAPMEIAIGRNVPTLLNNNIQVGDLFTLDLSQKEKSAMGIAINGTFTVVGILNTDIYDQSSGNSMLVLGSGSIASMCAGQDIGGLDKDIKIRLRDVGAVDVFISSLDIPESCITLNTNLINASTSALSVRNEIFAVIAPTACIIALASALILYNIFHISLNARIKLFGMLRAIGATKRQIGRIVRREAFILCGIAVPIGLVLAVLASFMIMPSIIQAIAPGGGFMPNNLPKPEYEDMLRETVAISWQSLIIAAISGLVLTLVSTIGPVRMVMQCSPIAAISQRLPEGKNRKSGMRLATHMLSLRLALRDMDRGRRKTVLSILSLVCSIILFLTFLSLAERSNLEDSMTYSGDYRIKVENRKTSESGMPVSLLRDIQGLEGVTHVYTLRVVSNSVPRDDGALITRESLGAIDDKSFNEILASIGINNASGGIALLEGSEVTPGDIPDSIVFDDKEVTIVGQTRISIPDYSLVGLKVIIRESEFQRLYGDSIPYKRFNVVVDSAYKPLIGKTLEALCSPVVSGITVHSWDDLRMTILEETRNTQNVIYAFCAIIALISSLNIMNTTLTNILQHLSEYGMQRAIGATAWQILSMTLCGCLIYACVALAMGIPMSLAIQMIMNDRVTVDPLSVIIVAFATILLCLLAAVPAIIRISHLNVVESIATVE